MQASANLSAPAKASQTSTNSLRGKASQTHTLATLGGSTVWLCKIFNVVAGILVLPVELYRYY